MGFKKLTPQKVQDMVFPGGLKNLRATLVCTVCGKEFGDADVAVMSISAHPNYHTWNNVSGETFYEYGKPDYSGTFKYLGNKRCPPCQKKSDKAQKAAEKVARQKEQEERLKYEARVKAHDRGDAGTCVEGCGICSERGLDEYYEAMGEDL